MLRPRIKRSRVQLHHVSIFAKVLIKVPLACFFQEKHYQNLACFRVFSTLQICGTYSLDLKNIFSHTCNPFLIKNYPFFGGTFLVSSPLYSFLNIQLGRSFGPSSSRNKTNSSEQALMNCSLPISSTKATKFNGLLPESSNHLAR